MPGIKIPSVIFGTSALGNLFMALDESEKLAIVRECLLQSPGQVVFDSAGKYGAGLALETLGKCLKELNVPPGEVIISNKLGWLRTELKTPEPTFEPGVWKGIHHDAVQQISYDGIIACFEQGNELLNGYFPQMVSVHDPDEYLAKATSQTHAAQLYDDILDAYAALNEMKQQGRVRAIGIGAKNWKVIQRIALDVSFDWVMIANSMTIKNHPKDLVDFIKELRDKGTRIINSAVFHSGFLVGGDYYDYHLIQRGSGNNEALFSWRDNFFDLCREYEIKPAEAAVQFALNVPGVSGVALSTTSPHRVREHIAMTRVSIPLQFWEAMKARGLVRPDYSFKRESVF